MTSDLISAETLTWYGLREEPFAVEPEARFFFPTPQHAVALEYCQRIVTLRSGIGIVYEGPGTGKSMLAAALRRWLERGAAPASFVVHAVDCGTLGRSSTPLLRDLAALFDVPKRTPNYRLLESIEREATRLVEKHTGIVLLFDRAELLDASLLQTLVHLWNLVTPDGSRLLLQMLLFSRRSLLRTLDLNKHAALRSRISFGSPELAPLNRDTLAALVRFRLSVAQAPADLFDEQALDLLREASDGVVGPALALASLALEHGRIAGSKTVTAAHVGSAREALEASRVA